MMAQAAVATGKVKGLFLEVHPEPAKALSDASTMLQLGKLAPLVRNCLKIWDSLKDDYEG